MQCPVAPSSWSSLTTVCCSAIGRAGAFAALTSSSLPSTVYTVWTRDWCATVLPPTGRHHARGKPSFTAPLQQQLPLGLGAPSLPPTTSSLATPTLPLACPACPSVPSVSHSGCSRLLAVITPPCCCQPTSVGPRKRRTRLRRRRSHSGCHPLPLSCRLRPHVRQSQPRVATAPYTLPTPSWHWTVRRWRRRGALAAHCWEPR